MKKGPADLVREEVLALAPYHVPIATGMVKLDAMENPYRLPDPLRDEVARMVATLAINRYPDPAAPELKARLRGVFAIPEECELLLGNGSDEIIAMAAQALARPDAVMLAPEPTFSMYRVSAILARMRFVGVPLNADFTLDRTRMLEAVATHAPALIFLAYPNNPSGNLFPEALVSELVAAAPGLVILDEAYHAFAGKTFMHRLAEFPNLVVMRTVSKLGLAGVRLGFAAGAPQWLRELDKVRQPYNVNTVTQAIAERVLAHMDVLAHQAERIKAERSLLEERLLDLPGVRIFPSDANFILVRVPDAERTFSGMKSRNVLVRNLNGSHPLLAHCLRLTVGTPGENELMMAALAESL
jgi:histidinol-phosphate aminotransferase